MTRRRARVCCLAIAALASACALPPTAEDAFYRLEVGPPSATLEAPLLAGILEVEPFRADPLTSGRAMIYRTAQEPMRVRRQPYTFWMDAPTAMLQREMARYLRAAGVAETIVTPNARTIGRYALTGTIVEFEQIRSGTEQASGATPAVALELELAIVERGSRNLLFQGTYAEERSARGADTSRIVDAFGRALASILERFVAELHAERSVSFGSAPASPQ